MKKKYKPNCRCN